MNNSTKRVQSCPTSDKKRFLFRGMTATTDVLPCGQDSLHRLTVVYLFLVISQTKANTLTASFRTFISCFSVQKRGSVILCSDN